MLSYHGDKFLRKNSLFSKLKKNDGLQPISLQLQKVAKEWAIGRWLLPGHSELFTNLSSILWQSATDRSLTKCKNICQSTANVGDHISSGKVDTMVKDVTNKSVTETSHRSRKLCGTSA